MAGAAERSSIFPRHTVYEALLSVWSRRPGDQYLQKFTRHTLAVREVWTTQAGRELRHAVKGFRATLVDQLTAATTQEEVQAAVVDFEALVVQWLDDLERHPFVQEDVQINRNQAKAVRMEVRLRRRNLKIFRALKRLGSEPTASRLLCLRKALKEMWSLVEIQDS